MGDVTGNFQGFVPALILLAGAVLIIRLAVGLAGKILLKLSGEGRPQVESMLERSSRAVTLITVFISVPIAAGVIPLGRELMKTVYGVSHTVIAFSAAFILYVAIDTYILDIIRKLGGKDGFGESLKPVLRSMACILISVSALIYVLGIWGVQVAPLIAGLGIAGLAFALALQPLLGNLFNGLALVLDKTFEVGDVIKLASGEMGSVYMVGLRTTKIKTFDNEMLIIPNTKLADTILQNFFQPDKSVRVGVEFGVEYGTDPEYVKKIALEEVNNISFIDKTQEPRVLFTEMADSSLNFRTLFWVDDISKKWPAHQEAISRIYRRLYDENIGIPFPQRTVWMREEGKARPVSPNDEKFREVRGKYFPRFGYEYTEDEPPAGKEAGKK